MKSMGKAYYDFVLLHVISQSNYALFAGNKTEYIGKMYDRQIMAD
ncbi:hypothetical protein [Butyrivibrio sp. VCD2006]|nr:hypothetical protein [Butyrivibrio sp. VCD2006]